MDKVTAFLLAAVTVTALQTVTFATEYTVGDDSGWVAGTFYYGWAQGKTFYAGDVLVFNYDYDAHNVVVVDEDGFNTCSTTNNLGRYNSGNDRLTLPEAGTYYFICEYHCGHFKQKLQVYVN